MVDNAHCVKCSSIIDNSYYGEIDFCPNCGISTKNYCPNCSPNGQFDENFDELLPNDKYCYSCGNKTIYYDYLMEKQN